MEKCAAGGPHAAAAASAGPVASPGKAWARRSAANLARRLRRERAVKAAANGGGEHLGRRLEVVARSLQLHLGHCLLVGRAYHFAAQAAVAARTAIGEGAFRRALEVHKAAGRAKHDWEEEVSLHAEARGDVQEVVVIAATYIINLN